MVPDMGTEQDFLAAYDAEAYERLSLAVDIAVLTVRDGRLEALMAQRPDHPYRDHWALPGGFVGPDESIHDAARRLLCDKARLQEGFIEQLFTFGDPGRDPRTRIVSVAYYALVHAGRVPDTARWFSLNIPWEGETGGPVDALGDGGEELPVAFDHADILGMAVKRIRGKLDYTPIGFQLLPERFTLRDLQTVHETVLGREVNKDSFRRKMLASGQLEATGEREQAVGHRPAELYRFARRSAI